VPPAPGMMARRVSGRATVALEAKTRSDAHRASSRPPPKASEETAAMEGMGSVERRVKVARRCVRKARVLLGAGGGRLERGFMVG
jgi:hypothetical protein